MARKIIKEIKLPTETEKVDIGAKYDYNGNVISDHIESTSNPHSVTKEQVGLGNVGNFKAVSTVASQGLTSAEKTNARTNIGAGTSNFSGDYNDLTNKPTIPTAGTLNTNNSTPLAVSSNESFSGTIKLHSVAKTGNADKVDGLMLNDQAMAYVDELSIEIACNVATLYGEMTEAELFAYKPTSSIYGRMYHTTDTNKYYRRKSTNTNAGANEWRDITTKWLSAAQLPNQLQDEPYIYIKIDTKQKYYSKLPKFFISASYDNVSGSTTVIGYGRQPNKFYINSCSYNGSNILGIYQRGVDTDIYYLKLKRYSAGYGAADDYVIKPSIMTNFINTGASIQFIGKNHSEYSTVSGYSFVAIPAYGVNANAVQYINGSTVPSSPKFTDTTYSLGTSASTTDGKINLSSSNGSTYTATIKGSGGTQVTSAVGGITISSPNITESTVAGWGFTKNTGTYSKPSGGIPSTDLASAVQTSLGKADTSVQPSAISDMATKTWVGNQGYGSAQDVSNNASAIASINNKIPAQASQENQLADKAFVNSSIENVAAYYITARHGSGTAQSPYVYEPFNTRAELMSTSVYYSGGQVRTPTRNDYCIVVKDETKDNATTRYLYNSGWEFQYIVNNSSLTQAQLDAINSGITEAKVQEISVNTAKVSNVQSDWNATSGLAVILNKPILEEYTATEIDSLWESVVV